MNPTDQRPGLNNSIGELLLIIYKIDENKNNHRKITMTHTQITCPNRTFLHAGRKEACHAEVGALVSVFKRSAIELKLKQKYKNANAQ